MSAIPDLSPALEQMSRLGTTEALALLEQAATDLNAIAGRWRDQGAGCAERAALDRLTAQLAQAGRLAEQGLALCRERENEILPGGAAYAPTGAAAPPAARASLSIDG